VRLSTTLDNCKYDFQAKVNEFKGHYETLLMQEREQTHKLRLQNLSLTEDIN